MKLLRLSALTVAGLLMTAPTWAQDTPPPPVESRPAIASYWGDTGLWFLPTAEVLRPAGWSFSVYRTELDFNQGFTDVSYWPATVAVGTGRAEIFGAVRAVTRIDRDTRPLFFPGQPVEEGGVINDQPFVREPWSGNEFGDIYLGTKVNLSSEYRLAPLAFAVRGTVKLPTADEEKGVGTGEYDYFADVIASKEMGRRVELTGFTGMAWRGDPDDVSLSDGVRWGIGAAFGARANVRFTTELHGEYPIDDDVLVSQGTIVGEDGSISPILTNIDTQTNFALGMTWQHRSGMLLGVGVNYRFGLEKRSEIIPGAEDTSAWGLQLRIGFHRGVRVYVPPAPPRIVAAPEPPAPPPPPPPAPVAAAPPPPPANRQPTLKAECDPCKIEVGRAVTVRAIATDPDGDLLNYAWKPAAGTIADTRATTTKWVAETRPGKVLVNVTADDGRGGSVSDSVEIEVVAAAIVALDDVLFDFDKADLRPDGIQVLTKAVKAMNDQPSLRLRIDGNASAEGTTEHNQELSERRAQAVRSYLESQGIAGSRLNTVGFGEERPKFDNTQESTRRLNRRAGLTLEQ